MVETSYAKYGVIDNNFQLRQNSSRLWKVLYPHFHNLQHLCHWNVSCGNILVWSSNWMGEILEPYSFSQLSVREALQNLYLV